MRKVYFKSLLGVLLVVSVFLAGCTPGPVNTTSNNEIAEPEPEEVNILEISDNAESRGEEAAASNNQEEEDSAPEPVEEEASPVLMAEVFFADGYGDEGLGIRVDDPDANIEEYSLEGVQDSQGHSWGFRTGNGAALSVADGNNTGDSYARFDLANEIIFNITNGAEILIEVEYLDLGVDEFTIEYDSTQGGLKSTDYIKKTDSGELRTNTFALRDAFFGDRLVPGGDFQINDLGDGAEIFIKVTVRVYSGEIVPVEPAEEEVTVDPEAVEGWAVLVEKDDYSDVGFSDMLVDHIDIELLNDLLLESGWDEDHIHALPEFDWDSLQAELDWLEEVADENDIVFLFVTGHSGYLRKVLLWEEFFPKEWAEIRSERRILLVDMCVAERFTKDVNSDPNPHLSIATTNENELGWKALKNENLSFIGAIFNHFFVEAFSVPGVDYDGDGRISIQEATIYGEEKQREMMHNEVFTVPEFLEGYHSLGLYPDQDPGFPHVIVDDAIGEPVFLDLDYYQ